MEESTKKTVTEPELEAELEPTKVIGEFAPDPDPQLVPEDPEAEAEDPEPEAEDSWTDRGGNVHDLVPARVDLDRLVFRAPMRNSQSVRYLQALLREAGHSCSPDTAGWYAGGTRDAVGAFQEANGMDDTGVADEALVEALFRQSRVYVWDR